MAGNEEVKVNPNKTLNSGVYSGYEINDDNVLVSGGDYAGEVLARCDAEHGTVRVPGVTFTAEEMRKLREEMNLGWSRERGSSKLFLDNAAGVQGTICIDVSQPAQNEWAVDQIEDPWYESSSCPLEKDRCDAVVDTIESAKPPWHERWGVPVATSFSVMGVIIGGLVVAGKAVAARAAGGALALPSLFFGIVRQSACEAGDRYMCEPGEGPTA